MFCLFSIFYVRVTFNITNNISIRDKATNDTLNNQEEPKKKKKKKKKPALGRPAMKLLRGGGGARGILVTSLQHLVLL